MKYLSVCSGIEAATVAWHDLKWEPQAFSEIEAFPSAVLKHHFPHVQNMGDMTKYKEWNIGRETINLVVGGTPCQSFSVAGLRKGLDDPRGNLMLTYLGIIDHFKPQWVVWENVPGVLSSNKGRDFGTFLGALAELGYGFAYRVLDAQFFGVPQRRRRVFVVGYLGDWRPPAAVLFESESLRRNTPKSRKTGEKVTGNVKTSPGSESINSKGIIMAHGQANAEIREDGNCPTLSCNHEAPILAVHTTGAGFWREGCGTLRAREQDSHENLVCIPINDKATRCSGGGDSRNNDGSGNGLGVGKNGDPSPTLTRGDKHAICFNNRQDPIHGHIGLPCGAKDNGNGVCFVDTYNGTIQDNACATITADVGGPTHSGPKIMFNSIVRRLMPVECEKLQGFPVDWTKIPWRNKSADMCPDSPRYKSIGNSMAVPVMKWIGERIQEVDDIIKS